MPNLPLVNLGLSGGISGFSAPEALPNVCENATPSSIKSFNQFLSNEANDALISAFLVLLRAKGETYEEINGEKKLTFNEFLKDPSGMEAVINAKALQSYHLIEDTDDTYSRSCVHRDIKSSNILIDDKFNSKISE
ncbi:predicted protein [Arabidopsis lyrata subsp. lyrata]|uniref:Predicted protein n=1 Tax=Arabidopsis lyrata subsp. lyrata TaxID=81972 RepID=D7LNC7_ARALL|nr:predicted protein [Arabidopsis lyrata subsp. lyrata]